MQSILRSFFRGLARLIIRLTLKLEIEGWANLPPPGTPLILISNHFSLFEAPILIAMLPYRDRLSWISATELQQSWFLKWMIRLFNLIPVWRGQPDRAALRGGLNWLAEGGVLGIMPEGSVDEVLRPQIKAGVQTNLHEGPNSRLSGQLLTPRPGAAYIALRSGAPILPVAFLGTQYVLDNLRRLRRTPVRMIIGPVFGPLSIDPALPKAAQREEIDELGHEMMRSLAALMPPENRGPYA